MSRLLSFDIFNRLFEGSQNSTSIIIGDSLVPLISRHVKNAAPISNTQGEGSLWKSGMGVTWLLNAVKSFPVSSNIKNVVISIGTNGGFNTRDKIKELFQALREKFPAAKYIIIPGSWGWGGNKGITETQVNTYYNKFKDEGGIVLPKAVGFSPSDADAHKDRPVLRELGSLIDGLIPAGSSPAPSQFVSTPVTPVKSEPIKTESGIIYRSGDPYRYKVVDDHWLAKRDDQQKWFEITGADYKPAFQVSIDKLDDENPNARSSKAPNRQVSGGSAKPLIVAQTSGPDETPRVTPLIQPTGKGKDPKVLDPDISKSLNFHQIPDGKGTNYRSAQFPEDIMREMVQKYGIKNVVRFNGSKGKSGDDKHGNYPSLSVEREEQILKELGVNFYKLSSRRNQKEVNDLLAGGNTLIHCAHGADRTGGNVGGYFYQTRMNPSLTTTDDIWKYTTQYNGWNKMSLNKPASFADGYLQQAQKFGVRDLAHAQELARKSSTIRK